MTFYIATKVRDFLGKWLKDSARYIVVADRQMDIQGGACGIALTSLEDPACDKKAGKRGWQSEWKEKGLGWCVIERAAVS